MNNIRKLITQTLSTITDIDISLIRPLEVVEAGKTYFSYLIQETNIGEDFSNNQTMEITLTGYLVRKEKKDENTIQIVDSALEEIKDKLKSLNFKYSYNDISQFDDGLIKIQVSARVRYNEMNNILLR